MLTSLFASYLDSNKTSFSESELNPLISRVYLIVSSIIKSKHEAENYNVKQIEEESIEFTALLCMKNERGIPLLMLNMKNDLDATDSELDFEFIIYDKIKRYLELL